MYGSGALSLLGSSSGTHQSAGNTIISPRSMIANHTYPEENTLDSWSTSGRQITPYQDSQDLERNQLHAKFASSAPVSPSPNGRRQMLEQHKPVASSHQKPNQGGFARPTVHVTASNSGHQTLSFGGGGTVAADTLSHPQTYAQTEYVGPTFHSRQNSASAADPMSVPQIRISAPLSEQEAVARALNSKDSSTQQVRTLVTAMMDSLLRLSAPQEPSSSQLQVPSSISIPPIPVQIPVRTSAPPETIVPTLRRDDSYQSLRNFPVIKESSVEFFSSAAAKQHMPESLTELLHMWHIPLPPKARVSGRVAAERPVLKHVEADDDEKYESTSDIESSFSDNAREIDWHQRYDEAMRQAKEASKQLRARTGDPAMQSPSYTRVSSGPPQHFEIHNAPTPLPQHSFSPLYPATAPTPFAPQPTAIPYGFYASLPGFGTQPHPLMSYAAPRPPSSIPVTTFAIQQAPTIPNVYASTVFPAPVFPGQTPSTFFPPTPLRVDAAQNTELWGLRPASSEASTGTGTEGLHPVARRTKSRKSTEVEIRKQRTTNAEGKSKLKSRSVGIVPKNVSKSSSKKRSKLVHYGIISDRNSSKALKRHSTEKTDPKPKTRIPREALRAAAASLSQVKGTMKSAVPMASDYSRFSNTFDFLEDVELSSSEEEDEEARPEQQRLVRKSPSVIIDEEEIIARVMQRLKLTPAKPVPAEFVQATLATTSKSSRVPIAIAQPPSIAMVSDEITATANTHATAIEERKVVPHQHIVSKKSADEEIRIAPIELSIPITIRSPIPSPSPPPPPPPPASGTEATVAGSTTNSTVSNNQTSTSTTENANITDSKAYLEGYSTGLRSASLLHGESSPLHPLSRALRSGGLMSVPGYGPDMYPFGMLPRFGPAPAPVISFLPCYEPVAAYIHSPMASNAFFSPTGGKTKKTKKKSKSKADAQGVGSSNEQDLKASSSKLPEKSESAFDSKLVTPVRHSTSASKVISNVYAGVAGDGGGGEQTLTTSMSPPSKVTSTQYTSQSATAKSPLLEWG